MTYQNIKSLDLLRDSIQENINSVLDLIKEEESNYKSIPAQSPPSEEEEASNDNLNNLIELKNQLMNIKSKAVYTRVVAAGNSGLRV